MTVRNPFVAFLAFLAVAALCRTGRLFAEEEDVVTGVDEFAAEDVKGAAEEAYLRYVVSKTMKDKGSSEQVMYHWQRLADMLGSRGKYAEATSLNLQILATKERLLGAEHPYTLASRNNLALLLDAQRRYAEAEVKHRALLAIRERVLGGEHPDVAKCCFNLAICLEMQAVGREAKLNEAQARDFAWRALAIWKKALGEGHPDTKAAQALVSRLEKP